MPKKVHVISTRRPEKARLTVNMKHRWPRSLHSQVEAVFHSIRSFRTGKADNAIGLRSFGSWRVYKYEVHRFAEFMLVKGLISLLDTVSVRNCMDAYLEERLAHYVEKRRSRQTMETILSAMGKFEYALNHYIEEHAVDVPPLATGDLRLDFYARGKKVLRKSSRLFSNRAYPDPVRLIEVIRDGTFQLQASLQYEGGLRAEGVGAPCNRRIKNPLTTEGLRGIGVDTVTGKPVGIVASVEKGGKETEHYVSVETYRRLEEYIRIYGSLESDYCTYVEEINRAARETGQYATGRGSHGLKHNFAQERYLECIDHGMTHEQALQQASLETSHFRLRETLKYTGG
jgi:hypothetical protein